jgi:hypothetical protein
MFVVVAASLVVRKVGSGRMDWRKTCALDSAELEAVKVH